MILAGLLEVLRKVFDLGRWRAAALSVRDAELDQPTTSAEAWFDEDAFPAALRELHAAAPEAIARLGPRLAALCLLWRPRRRRHATTMMKRLPDLPWVLSFDGDGYIREAALRRLEQPPTYAFQFIAITLRLNDWVKEVREAATEAAFRLFPDATPEAVAQAAPFLMNQRFVWGRWAEEVRALDDAFQRADVTAALATLLLTERTGGRARTLRHALRFPAMDTHLVALANDAFQPSVRATALQALISGRASWPIGHEWEWIDKTFGQRRRKTRFGIRSITCPRDVETLIRSGLTDPSAVVRRVAADGLIDHRDVFLDLLDVTGHLAEDRSAAVRERADFLTRHMGQPIPFAPTGA